MNQSPLVVESCLDAAQQFLVIGLRPRAELRNQFAIPANQILMEVPGGIGAGFCSQLVVEGMRIAFLDSSFPDFSLYDDARMVSHHFGRSIGFTGKQKIFDSPPFSRMRLKS